MNLSFAFILASVGLLFYFSSSIARPDPFTIQIVAKHGLYIFFKKDDEIHIACFDKDDNEVGCPHVMNDSFWTNQGIPAKTDTEAWNYLKSLNAVNQTTELERSGSKFYLGTSYYLSAENPTSEKNLNARGAVLSHLGNHILVVNFANQKRTTLYTTSGLKSTYTAVDIKMHSQFQIVIHKDYEFTGYLDKRSRRLLMYSANLRKEPFTRYVGISKSGIDDMTVQPIFDESAFHIFFNVHHFMRIQRKGIYYDYLGDNCNFRTNGSALESYYGMHYIERGNSSAIYTRDEKFSYINLVCSNTAPPFIVISSPYEASLAYDSVTDTVDFSSSDLRISMSNTRINDEIHGEEVKLTQDDDLMKIVLQ